MNTIPRPRKQRNQGAITASLLRDLVSYDEGTGSFTRLKNVRGSFAGPITPKPQSNGYVSIWVANGRYSAHRLAWLYVYGEWPRGEIDHINGVKDDNRISNLRDVARHENEINKAPRGLAKSGAVGVVRANWTIHKTTWYAQIKCNGKRYYLGSYPTVEEASAAYEAAAQRLHGEHRRGAQQ